MTDFPDDLRLIKCQIILLLTGKDTVAANRYIKEFLALSGEKDVSQAETVNDLGNIYSSAGMPDEAEKYYRKAVALEPDNPVLLNALAYFLINTENNLPEGLGFAETALKLSPDNSFYLDTKGWGLYKLGKYEEALKLLEKSWQLRPDYNYTLSSHLEEVKKAIASHKVQANSKAP
jgi:tetratricopeptide (TPR) repeat protein